jgi:hypothetical protein
MEWVPPLGGADRAGHRDDRGLGSGKAVGRRFIPGVAALAQVSDQGVQGTPVSEARRF